MRSYKIAENAEGSISFMRGCGFEEPAKVGLENCDIINPGEPGESKICYKICDTPLCNGDSMNAAFPYFSINCVHCSSTVQPWCMQNDLKQHLNDPGVKKKCWNENCLATRSGKNITCTFKKLAH